MCIGWLIVFLADVKGSWIKLKLIRLRTSHMKPFCPKYMLTYMFIYTYLTQVPRDRVPHSHPGFAITVAVEVARLKNCPVDEVLQATRENTRFMYGI